MTNISITETKPASSLRLEEAATQSTTSEQAAEDQIYTIYNRYLKTGDINLFEIIILLVAFSSLFLSWINYLRLLKTPLSNIITYLTSKQLKNIREIENILAEMLAVSECNRVLVGLFHNGNSINKHHFNKMSVFYEVVTPGIEALKEQIQNIMLSKIYRDIESSNKDIFTQISVEDKSLKSRCVIYLDSIGVNHLLSRLLVDDNKGIYGILQLHWVDNTNENILEDPSILFQLNKLFNRLINEVEEVEVNKFRLFH